MSGFHHEALFYRGDGAFVEATLPFIRAGVAADEPILIAVSEQKIAHLREALGADAARVRFEDMRSFGRNPARIIPVWRSFVDEHAASGQRLRGIGEPAWPGRTRDELDECRAHESLLNVAFDHGRAWSLLCPYDIDGLDADTVAAARATHRCVCEDGVSRPSAHFHPISPFTGALPEAPPNRQVLRFTGSDLGVLRRFVEQGAHAAGLHERAPDLVLAATEVAGNSVRHGGGQGTLRMWPTGDALVCEVADSGRFVDVLVGRVRPYAAPDVLGGAGLWLANHLCDLVQIRSNQAGSVVRLHMQLG
jgi:anti-sigma regulatory factor (Ser/Thr protein kinase)